MPQIMLAKLSDIASTASSGVNLTNAEVAAKLVQGTLGLLVKGVTDLGGICCDKSGNLFLTDKTQHVVIKVEEGGRIKIVAGVAGSSGNNTALQHVAAATARFNTPKGIACDNTGNLYVADSGNNQIRKIAQDGYVSVFAGNGAQTAGLVDSSLNALQAQFNNPTAVAVDNAGVVYVADTGNHAVRKIWGGTVLTIAGGVSGDNENCRASKITGVNAIFNAPNGIAIDAKGNIFVNDGGNLKIKKITPNGWVYLHSGSGSFGRSLGTSPRKAYTCTYGQFATTGLTVDKYGYLYVNDIGAGTERLLKIDPNGVPAVAFDFTQATTYYQKLAGVAVSPSQKVFVAISATEEYTSSSSSIDSSSSSSSSSEGYTSSSSSSS